MSKEKNKQIHNNHLLYDYLCNKGLVAEKTLLDFVRKCNEEGSNLGHSLVQNRLLSMSDLSTFLQHISGKTNEMQATALDLKISAKNKDFGKYVLIEEIARGGMGIVYKAIQKDIKRLVALKVVMGSGNLQPRFLREARACATLNHPHIVPVYEVGNFNGVHFFSMQYIEGTTLADILQEQDVVEKIARNVEWLVQIAAALSHSHQKGIIHRDVKPSNILIDKNNHPFLADFGLAQMDNSYQITKTGEVIGTPFFMSPEQVDSRKLDARTDIYSLGVILYQILTSQLPFSGNNLSQLYLKILHEKPVSPQDLGAPASFSNICLKAMEKNPEVRYQNANDFAQDLRLALSGKYRKKHIDKLKKVYVSGKRNVLVVGITLLSIAVIGSIYFLWDTFQFATLKQKQLQDIDHLIAQHQYNDAKTQLENLQQQYPNNAEIHAKQAQIYFFLKETSQAIESISTAIELQPNKGYMLLKAMWLREKNLYKEALVIYRQLSQQVPQAQFEIAQTLFLMAKYDEALHLYQTLLTKPTHHIQIKIQLGKIYFLKNDLTTSLHYLQEVEQSPNTSQILLEETFYYLGKIFEKQQRIPQAIAMYKKVEKSREKFADIDLRTGFSLAKQRDFSTAIVYLELANENHKSTKLYHTLAKCYHETAHYEKAIEFYDKCIAREPWQFEFYATRGLCYEKMEKFDESAEDFLKASILGPNNLESLAHLYSSIFHYRLLEKRYELEKRISHLLLMRYKNQATNLFEVEYQQLAKKYMQEYDNIVLAPVPQLQQVDRFIALAIKKTSSEIKQIATSALKKLYHSDEVLLRVAKHKALQNLHETMRQQHDELQRKYVRQLLVRYYIIKDISALNTLYSKYIEVLKNIFLRDNESSIIRFFAIKTLVHMRQINTHQFILRHIESPQNSIRLMICAALVSENIHSIAFHREFTAEQDPFLRMLQVRYLVDRREQLASFLQDENIKVQLTAATKLWRAGYREAEKIFVQSFVHSNAAVRAFACSHFWEFTSAALQQYTIDKYLPLLVKTLRDTDSRVQRISILRMSQLPKVKVVDYLKPLLQNESKFVKLQALIAIGVRGDLATVADFIQQNDEAYLQASLFVITKLTSERKMRSLSLIGIMNRAIESSNPHFAVFVLKTIGRIQEVGARYIYKYIDHPNESVRAGTVLGLYRYGNLSMLPKIVPFLESKTPILQDAAAFTVMSIISRQGNNQLLDKYQKIIRDKGLQLNGSYAYVRDLHIKTELGSAIRHHQSIDWDVLYPTYYRKFYSKIFHFETIQENFINNQIFLLNKALDLAPHHDRYLFFIALLYTAKSSYQQAREYLEKAIAAKPLTVYYYWLAFAYYGENNYDKSLEALEKYQKYYFLDIDAVQLRYEIYRAKNNQEQLQKTWQRLQILKLK